MFVPFIGDIWINAFDALVGDLLRAGIARVRTGRYRFRSRVLLDLFQHWRQLLFIVGILRDIGSDDDLRFGIHGDLRVVGLHEAAFLRSIGHDPTVGIGEVALRLVLGFRLLRIRYLWWTATYLLSRLFFLLLPRRNPGFCGRLLLLGFLPRFRLQRCFRFLDLFQPTLPPRQFFWQLIGLSLPFFFILGGVDGFGALEQFFDLGLQLLFRFTHAPITHRLVLARVGLLLGPVQGHMSQLHQPRRLTQSQSLREQPCQRFQMSLPKFVDRAVIWMFIGTQIPERHVFVCPLLDLPRTHHTNAVAIDQQPYHHHRMVGCLASPIFFFI